MSSGNSKSNQIITIIVSGLVTLLIGGSAPWWWHEFFASKTSVDPPETEVVKEDSTKPNRGENSSQSSELPNEQPSSVEIPLESSTAKFSGEWYNPQYKYAFQLDGRIGVATLSNSPKYQAGDVVLQINFLGESSFQGRQVFTDGLWYNVTGQLRNGDSNLFMEGGGYTWVMVKQTNGQQ